MKLFGETVEVNAQIETLQGISGHADKNGLLGWLEGFQKAPDHVFVVHGEDTVTDHFAQAVTERFGWPAFAPYSGGCVDLPQERSSQKGSGSPSGKPSLPAQRSGKSSNVLWPLPNGFCRWFIRMKVWQIRNW